MHRQMNDYLQIVEELHTINEIEVPGYIEDFHNDNVIKNERYYWQIMIACSRFRAQKMDTIYDPTYGSKQEDWNLRQEEWNFRYEKRNSIIFEYCKSKGAKQLKKYIFEDYLVHPNKKALMIKLHELIDNTKTKNIITVLKALREKGFIVIGSSNAKLYDSMRKEFAIKISNSGANDFYFNNSKIPETEIDNIEKLLD